MNVKGLSIEDIRKIDISKIEDLKEIKQITNRLISASNKRYRRLLASESGKFSPALERFKKVNSGQAFSLQGKTTRSQVVAEYKRAMSFLDPSKTSHTVRGWNKTLSEIVKSGIPKELLTDPDFWKGYREFSETGRAGMESVRRADASNETIKQIRVEKDGSKYPALKYFAEQYQKGLSDNAIYEQAIEKEKGYFNDVNGDADQYHR